MKTHKKVIITVGILIIIAVCGVIVHFTKSDQKMLVGGFYNGEYISSIVLRPADNQDYNFKQISDLEKLVAKNTSIMIVEMKADENSENTKNGTATLRIVSPNIENYLNANDINVSAETEDEFNIEFQSAIYDLIKTNKIASDAKLIEVNIVYTKNNWKIVPSKELYHAVTGNVNYISHNAWAEK